MGRRKAVCGCSDVRNLLSSVQDLDLADLDRWADRLGLGALYQEVRP